ncbi:MAG: hypothetical protein K2N06_09680 [Oscillospiraceae bacterium]|nr:hypothetical protein [Oscillospiraceae bacterium]
MRNIRKLSTAAIAVAMVLSLAACADKENPSGNSVSTATSPTANNSKVESTTSENADAESTPKTESTWDILPEIDVTEASAFKYEYDSELGGMVVTGYIEESAEVRIPDTLEGKPVTEIGDWAFEDCTSLTIIIFRYSVTEIGFGAFWVC